MIAGPGSPAKPPKVGSLRLGVAASQRNDALADTAARADIAEIAMYAKAMILFMFMGFSHPVDIRNLLGYLYKKAARREIPRAT